MSGKKYLIDDRVIFDCERMTLSRSEETVTLSEAERNLLLAFYQGLFKKDELIAWVWGRKGVVVSDASYYKLLNQLRNSFTRIGLESSSLVTRPKVGVELVVPITLIEPDSGQKTDDLAAESQPVTPDATQPAASSNAPLKAGVKDWFFFAMAGLLLVAAILASRQERQRYFAEPITHDGYRFYTLRDDKTSYDDVIEAYAELTTPVYKQNGRHIYYIRVPDVHIFVQCLNQLNAAEPKCITLKERY
ncbi:winged helix-turn-helix domain-containing protein [Citrobacter rodentium]|jgi:DNA-binding winged-HTH domains|uniref:Transmembrane regulator n=2 Tax=Citrobacter rodentium TaxID=67825 RepID=D2TJN2_CITRI|nr:transcriptional regulator [Citrobacter rodentium]KIQ51427.1 response regulator [Citrobacter rodentium]QBY29385.1 response regulator [Citrobacter rodentium]UHO33213.1 response regulator [Citrobacter rodentium NBRC 105723 = DSM 16636]CBG89670.1 putative transmembrane regulator [Citrobacter rodentium ICC168]HAT8015402.1 response regulator [Citrobacter rodentium NBRC 105723 = DSM 16636]